MKILILIRHFGFPNGMAATQRTLLMAKALVEQGASVRVLCTTPSEWRSKPENETPCGEVDEIQYEYTLGTVYIGKNKMTRAISRLSGSIKAMQRICELKRMNQADCVHIYFPILDLEPARLFFILFCKTIRVPVTIELCERPWTLAPTASKMSKRISPFWNINGALSISRFLTDYAKKESKALVFEMPILADPAGQAYSESRDSQRIVLFAGAPQYSSTIEFIYQAMEQVWEKFPDCNLKITGCEPNDPAGKRILAQMDVALRSRVVLCGYLTRYELLHQYSTANALLIPLLDDLRSNARFPTKIAEYACSGKAIVTTNIGEIKRFFTDGENAYVSSDVSPEGYAKKIIEALSDPEQARRIGTSGRAVAENHFAYRHWGKALNEFFKDVVDSYGEKGATRP